MNSEKHYMGQPCRRGHPGLRYRSNNTCIECVRERDQGLKETRREYFRKYNKKYYEENVAYWVKRQARQIRMSAGGIQFHLGYAPTAEAAEYLRKKIKEEAPK